MLRRNFLKTAAVSAAIPFLGEVKADPSSKKGPFDFIWIQDEKKWIENPFIRVVLKDDKCYEYGNVSFKMNHFYDYSKNGSCSVVHHYQGYYGIFSIPLECRSFDLGEFYSSVKRQHKGRDVKFYTIEYQTKLNKNNDSFLLRNLYAEIAQISSPYGCGILDNRRILNGSL